MQTFEYTVKDEIGLHARPAGLLAKAAKEFESEIVVEKDGKSASATKLMALMTLGVKCGDTVRVSVSGSDENIAAEKIKAFLAGNL